MWAIKIAPQLDGKLVMHGRRLVDLSFLELLNYTYSQVVEYADSKGRQRIDAMLEGRLGEGGGILVDDPDLPPSMQGKEAPDWWDDDGGAMTSTGGDGNQINLSGLQMG